MDKSLFDNKVAERGIKYAFIAEKLNISGQALTRKRNGNIPFKISEIKILKEILDLSDKDISKIFL